MDEIRRTVAFPVYVVALIGAMAAVVSIYAAAALERLGDRIAGESK